MSVHGQTGHMSAENILFISDSASADDEPLYHGHLPRVGASSVVVPIRLPVRSDSGEWHIRFHEEGAPRDAAEVWSGVLEFPSGRVVSADWSMEPGPTHEVLPGSYQVRVGEVRGWISISLSRVG